MATKKTTQTKNKKPTTRPKKSKSTPKKTLQSNYEIKLILLVSITILSVLGLHLSLMGFVGAFTKNLYFGLFSYAGYGLPYIILVGGFYYLNKRLLAYKKKTILGLSLFFLGLMLFVNILNYDLMASKFIHGSMKVLSFQGLKALYLDGINLSGSGLIGGLIGRGAIALVGKIGLYLMVATLWILSFLLITNIKVSDKIKAYLTTRQKKRSQQKVVKDKAKEEYLKGAEKLEQERQKAVDEKLQIKEKEIDKQSKEALAKALEKVDKKLKAEEKDHKQSVDAFDAMFAQSPTRSIVDKVFKKTPVPTKEDLKKIQVLKNKKDEIERLQEETFKQFESKGYAFDDDFTKDEVIASAPDIFDNHIDAKPPSDVAITGFGSMVNAGIKKAYESSDQPMPEDLFQEVQPKEKEEKLSSFDQAFLIAEQESRKNVTQEVDFSKGTPMSQEEKVNASKFDVLTHGNGNSNTIPKVETVRESSQIPDQKIIEHMSEKIKQEFDNYRVPKIHILKKNKALVNENKNALYEKAKYLEEILSNFNVDAQVIEISKGPAITRYEIELKPGTKMSKITNLSDDIALHLATQQVRIAPVPNKAAVGIEVPNEDTSIVTLREVLDSPAFSNNKSKLSAGLGKNISGAPIVADLAKMPHMLIAGATGSGKSVCVNTLITSILLNANPNEVKFLMIDPKVVELNNYNGIPHLILPVVTDPKKASIALNWAVQEMTRRYNAFAESGSRDITGFNKKFGDDPDQFMPQIVVIIDELADLMMVAPNQVEDAICRLAQMARAAGIHLIVATQRPSVDVITGVIKANIPSRIAFAVSSAIDSRTIIDMSGAEKLLGKGDMLYYPVGSTKPQRVQGAFISEEEVETVVNAVKNQFEAFAYDESILDSVNSESSQGSSDASDAEDEHLQNAIHLVVEMEQASISMLQRKFKIGYNRAARLVDEMEARGIVGPSLGSKPRNVLISSADLNE